MMKKNLFQIGGFALLMCLLTFVGTLSAQQEQVQELPVFATDGSSWTVPTTLNGNPIKVTSVTFHAWGGGGAGSYVYITNSNRTRRSGGGGGGGAYATVTVDNPTGTYNFTIGQGGTGVRNSVTHGGATTITQDGTTILNAVGGRTAATTSNDYTATGAQGGQASACSGITGFTAVSGADGGNGTNSTIYQTATSGAGGQAGGTFNPGENVGAGGSSVVVRGSSTGSSAGNIGGLYGGGGSGAAGYRRTSGTVNVNGGAGAAGAVYVTYTYLPLNIEVEDIEMELCANAQGNASDTKEFTITLTNIEPADLSFVITPITNGITVSQPTYANGKFSITVNTTNTTNTLKKDTVKIVASSLSATKTFYVTTISYAKLQAGSITATEYLCDGASTLISNVLSATGGKNPVYSWRYGSVNNYNNTNNTSSNSNTEYFTPQVGNYYYWRIYADEFCKDTVHTTSVHVERVNPSFNAGTINYNKIDTICPNNGGISEYIILRSTATNTTSGIQYIYTWERRYKYRPNPALPNYSVWSSWQQAYSPSNNYYNPYTVNGSTVSRFRLNKNELTTDPGFEYEYRYTVKPVNGTCDALPCEGTYKIVVREPANYQSQFNANPKTITLWYGEPDTNLLNMAAPTLTSPTPNTIEKPYIDPNATEHVGRLTPGTYTFYWRVYDACDYARIYSQTVKVVYPVCGEDFQVDYNTYKTYRYGSECWMIENLRTDIAGGTFYEDNAAEYGKFGRLYSWNAAVGADNTTTTKAVAPSGKTYVQGACPDGWAIPTKAQFNELLGAYSMDQLKSNDQTTWLQGMQGNNESHFGIVGAGYYDATAGKYMKLLGYAGFWTADEKVGMDSQAETIGVVYGCDDNQTPSTNKENKLSIRCVRVK